MRCPMDWWKEIWTQPTSSWTFIEIYPHDGSVQSTIEVEPNSAYLNIFLKSLRLRDVRKGLVRFYGAVHSFVSVPHQSGDKASFQVFTSPASLQKLDSRNADRILVLDQRLVGPVPFRGGDVDVQIGLFSIKEADVTDAYLKVL